MAIYERLRGGQGVQKIPVWPLINSFVQLLAGEIDDAELVTRFSLGPAEQQEFAQAKQHIASEIAGDIAEFVGRGFPQELSDRAAKALAATKYREILLRVEHGYYTERQFKDAMGIS